MEVVEEEASVACLCPSFLVSEEVVASFCVLLLVNSSAMMSPLTGEAVSLAETPCGAVARRVVEVEILEVALLGCLGVVPPVALR